MCTGNEYVTPRVSTTIDEFVSMTASNLSQTLVHAACVYGFVEMMNRVPGSVFSF